MDGHDYDVIYKGMVIGNIKAFSDEEATELAKQIYGPDAEAERS